ncbi:hypothetical protein DYB36_004493 [Aphanomyces astaci]|uniref:YTH domain-containing protein n=1 Tax=Aphanomyces astaci TaxID=112090 RepID=A0A397AXS6_APHAT|nr:hypothetical protein DYB36_004493 [Aphanomyces astaci]
MDGRRKPQRRKHKPVALGPRFNKDASKEEGKERNKNIVNDVSVFDDTVLTPYLRLGTCRYFVIKSFSEANVHKRMTSAVNFDLNFGLWEKQKYEGYFRVEWLVLKDVPNHVLMKVQLNQKSFPRACDGDEVAYNEVWCKMIIALAQRT